MSSKKSKDPSPATLEDLVNQVIEKSKQLSMSMKEQRKLVQEYMNAKIYGSEESYGECVCDFSTDSDTDSDSDSDSVSDSDSEEDSITDSDEQTEESSDDSESELSEVEEASSPGDAQGSATKNSKEPISKDEPEPSRLVAFVPPPQSPGQPAPRIQRRLTMAGGMVAAPVPPRSGRAK
ncbi:serine-aspartate repeat-containing protein C [Drosophila yakuba]|uniref:Uncharacterized protein n=1 Tax=Drosophila yakuba TaxID=7245 RepID=A0A0R1DQ16_DROYA|nr:serine-aspartate repeat-containing protein C [Drosophila yakuba]KRJ97057.1 uncharacterized protein Dyak_GE28026 [Drosophila yakuba]